MSHTELEKWSDKSCLFVAAYDGPQSYELQNPDSASTTKVQVLQVTSEHSHTEDLDSDDEIPTIPTGGDQPRGK